MILCPCYKDDFFPAGNDCIKESIHFKCVEENIFSRAFLSILLEQTLLLEEIICLT